MLGLVLAILVLTTDPSIAQLVERPLITGRHGMVTSLHPLSSLAGLKILMKGGNAFDAAVATAVATTVVDPKNSTIGGQGFATIYAAKTGEVRALNFFGPSPKAATIDAFKGKDYTRGYLSCPVPSNLKGYQVILETYGTMSWEQVLEPAIELAQNGFVVTQEFTQLLEEQRDELNRYPETARVFFKNGVAPRPGEIFIQADLARTLREVAKKGPDVFYKGEIARQVDEFFNAHGGLLSYGDLASYEAQWVEPISTSYRGYTIYTQPPNSSAIAMLMQLNILEGYDVTSYHHNSAEYLHLVAEVMRLALADRNQYVADPEFVSIPVSSLLSKEYAGKRRQLIDLRKTIPVVRPGEPMSERERDHTTHLTVVDRDGNMVALTQTLGAWYGSGVVVGNTGVIFSNQMRHLHLDPKSPSLVGPGRRPRSNQSPTIVLKDGRPFMAIGTPGGDGIWQRLTQVMVNILDFKMDIQTAISKPRIILGGFQETGTEIRPVLDVEERIPPDVRRELSTRGFIINIIADDEGRVNGIIKDPKTGFLLGGADPRSETYAIGW
jgi:gamma-glutamyltranspeptidase/glutathione hydrolase